jgi:hypothetical protein
MGIEGWLQLTVITEFFVCRTFCLVRLQFICEMSIRNQNLNVAYYLGGQSSDKVPCGPSSWPGETKSITSISRFPAVQLKPVAGGDHGYEYFIDGRANADRRTGNG